MREALDTEFLTPAEIKTLTDKARPGDQVEELERLRVPFRIGGGDRPLVSRIHVRQWLSGVEVPRPRGPNLAAVR